MNLLLTFANYLLLFNKTYTNPQEYERRETIFYGNQRRIEYHNTRNYTYGYGYNYFTDNTFSEFRDRYLNYVYRPQEKERVHVSSQNRNTSVDWRSSGIVNHVKNQGECGSCWAFSGVSAIESMFAKRTGVLYDLSEQEMVDCVPDCFGCNGGWPTSVYKYVMRDNITSDNKYPYIANDEMCNISESNSTLRVRGYKVIMNTTKDVLNALYELGPLSVALDAEDSFQMYNNGIYESNDCSSDPEDMDHAVMLVGYGVDQLSGKLYFILRNSWGTDWGVGGYMYFSGDISNMCGILNDVTIPY
jgi:C1A family cysteine protease